MRTRGFTLIELLVVIVIIGILVAIALPNFIKIKDKAKEAETKQNLHSIQLAVERYATDMGGNYPYFLYGGDSRYNIGTAAAIAGNYTWDQTDGACLPFDLFNANIDDGWCYDSVPNFADLASPDLEQGFGDTLAFEGYMPKYPSNPFVEGKARTQFNLDWIDAGNPWVGGCSAWGGEDGTKMFNSGWYSELPIMHKAFPTCKGNILEFPGQFFYHARWVDGVTNYGHNRRQQDLTDHDSNWLYISPTLNDKADCSSIDVAAYDLVAYGSVRTKGQDLDNNIPSESSAPRTTGEHKTGYLTLGQERNPWVTANMYGTNGNYADRPYSDSIPDFFIIHLSSGIDKKIQDEMQKS